MDFSISNITIVDKLIDKKWDPYENEMIDYDKNIAHFQLF